MIKTKEFIKKLPALAIILALLIGVGSIAYASDIDDALYIGKIIVSNNGTNASAVSVNCSINTMALVTDDYMEHDCSNSAIQNQAGDDVPYMPQDNGIWAMFVPSIEQDRQLNYQLYTGGNTTMASKLRYFPAAGGMTTTDSASIELGDNFTIEQRGWIDTDSGANKNLVYKQDAFKIYVSDTVSGNITVGLTPTPYTFYPDAHVESTSVDGYTEETTSADWATMWAAAGDDADDTGTSIFVRFYTTGAAPDWAYMSRGNILIDTSSLPDDATITSASLFVYGSQKQNDAVADPSLNVYSSNPAGDIQLVAADYHNSKYGATAFSTAISYADFSTTGYNEFALNASGIAAISKTSITKLALREANYEAPNNDPGHPGANKYAGFKVYSSDKGAGYKPYLEIQLSPLSVTATGVSSGEHTVKTTADSANLTIYIDSELKDTVALGGASVSNNANNWAFLQNYAMPYMEYHKISVNSTLKQHIVWENTDGDFNDLTAYNNDATPTYRTTSSDPDVSAELVSFEPISQATFTGSVAEETADLVQAAPDMPPGMYEEMDTSHLPGSDVVNTILGYADIPLSLIWLPLTFGLAALAGFVVYAKSRSLLAMCIVSGFILVFFSATGIVPFWVLIPFAIMVVAILMKKESPAPW